MIDANQGFLFAYLGVKHMKQSKTVKTFDVICVSLLVVISVMALAQVLFRYVLKISVPWTEEVSRLLYGFLIFNGVVLLEAENNQMKTTFLLDRFPKKVRFFVQLFINVASIGFLLLMFIGSLRMVRSSWTINLGSVPWISQAVIYLLVIFSMPFAIYFLIKQMIHYEEYFLIDSEDSDTTTT